MADDDYLVPEPDPDEPIEAGPVDAADGGDPYPTDRSVDQDSQADASYLRLPELPADALLEDGLLEDGLLENGQP